MERRFSNRVIGSNYQDCHGFCAMPCALALHRSSSTCRSATDTELDVIAALRSPPDCLQLRVKFDTVATAHECSSKYGKILVTVNSYQPFT